MIIAGALNVYTLVLDCDDIPLIKRRILYCPTKQKAVSAYTAKKPKGIICLLVK